mgnify:CR=1 FL=1|jgi:hypothetical protein
MSVTKITDDNIDSMNAAKLTGVLPAMDGSNLTGIESGGAIKQWKQAVQPVNSSGLLTTSTTMADIPGCTVTLNNLVIGNIIEISAQVVIFKNTGYYSHPGVGVLKDGVMLDNVTWGIGVSMQPAEIWISREPYITCINATATSHTFQLQGNVNYGSQICFGGDMSGNVFEFSRIRMIAREITV